MKQPMSMDEKIAKVVERADKAARNGCQGHEINLSVADYEERIRETKAELVKLEGKRDQAELDMGTMLSNSATAAEGDEALAKVNALEVAIRKTRSTMQAFLLRLGDQKRLDDARDIRKVQFIERYGCEGEEKLCAAIDKAMKKLSQSCHELKSWKEKIDYARYQCTGARARPNHVGYAVSQRLIGEDMNQFLHLGGKNHSFLKSSLYETLHPNAGTGDAIPPLPTEEDREAKLKELIEQKHAEVRERSRLEDEQEQASQDNKPISEENEPLPGGAELCQKVKEEKGN